MSAPWPFVTWGIDVIGPIEPKAFDGHQFILVSIFSLILRAFFILFRFDLAFF